MRRTLAVTLVSLLLGALLHVVVTAPTALAAGPNLAAGRTMSAAGSTAPYTFTINRP